MQHNFCCVNQIGRKTNEYHPHTLIPPPPSKDWGEPTASYENNWFKFKTAGYLLPIHYSHLHHIPKFNIL